MKIGGSVITHKDENLLKAKEDMIRDIVKEIKSSKNDRLVFVHGAGPFGHKLVTDYGIKNGLYSEKDIEGFVRTHNSVEDLNKVIANTFREEGLLGFPVQPSACIVQDNKKIISFDISIIKSLLDMDVIPIMYGDVVIDRSLKGSVVSGDAVLAYLAKHLNVDKILLGSDVDGIFTADPKRNPDAVLIERIDSSNFDEVIEKVEGAKTVDVTGGMKKKLLEMKENLNNKKIIIFNANKQGNVSKALLGEEVGTTIEF